MDSFYVPNEINYYYNNFILISENKKAVTPIISKNACSTLVRIALLEAGKECNVDKYDRLGSLWTYRNRLLVKNDDLVNYKKFAVIRNPLDRICSAYNTVGNNLYTEDYVNKVINTLENFNPNDINRHITSQFVQYDLSLIDEFVPIEYLDEYLRSIGIDDVKKVNVSKSSIKIDNERLMELLSNDFKIYNEILNGNKCFKPSNVSKNIAK